MKNLKLTTAVALLCTPMLSSAETTVADAGRLNAVVNAGYGVNYKARIKPDKTALTSAEEFVIKTDDKISPSSWGPKEAFSVPLNKSMGWNDTATNPDIPSCGSKDAAGNVISTKCLNITDIDKGFGWGHSSHWYLVDLNNFAGQKVYVSVMVERYDDGNHDEKNASGVALPSDDDLIPGLTVWVGNQDQGTHTHWFQNKHQATATFDGVEGTPYWTRKLSKPNMTIGKKTYALKGMSSGMVGWDSAFGVGNQDMAMVSGEIMLDKKDPNKNFLTIATGGDARHAAAASKHDVNYKLTVQVAKSADAAAKAAGAHNH